MSSLRLAWLSPFSDRSDISAFSKRLLPHFADESCGPVVDCHLFVNENGPTQASPVPTMKLPWGVSTSEILSAYDATVFNLGNNVENHAQILETLVRLPGIAILHDFSYHHLFANRCFEQLKSPAAYARLMHDWYGSRGFSLAIRSGAATRGQTLYSPWDSDHVADFPLLEPIAGLASAIVVHSKFMEERLRPFFKGPILRLFLPHDQKVAPSTASLERWREEAPRRRDCLFVTFGHIGRSKCLDVVIRAFAQSTLLTSNSKLLIAGRPGDANYVRELQALARSLGLGKQVLFEFSITDERLLAIKEDADVFINLRYPNTEGASGSLTEMMNAAKPVIAYRSGCYADVPEHAAVLLNREDGPDAIVQAMESLAQNAAQRIEIGRQGHAVLQAEDSREYVRRLKSFIVEMRGDLRRRSKFVSPLRDGCIWQDEHPNEADAQWFEQVSRSRRTFLLLERDKDVLSPEPFLRWPTGDLVPFVSRTLLDSPDPAELASSVAVVLERAGRWSTYCIVALLRRYQDFCQQEHVSPEAAAPFARRVPDIDFWTLAFNLRRYVASKMLYLAVLGRSWGPGEPEQWMQKLQSGIPGWRLLSDFLASPEYRQSFPDRLMKDLGQWATDQLVQGSLGTAPQDRAPLWQANVLIRFDAANPEHDAFLADGWYPRESVGSWSKGSMGRLRFSLPPIGPKQSARLEFRVRVIGTKVTGQRTLMAYCNQQKISTLEVDDDAYRHWTIALPAEAMSSRAVDLMLIANAAFSPAEAGLSQDVRELGLLVSEGKLVLMEEGADIEAPSSEPLGGVPTELDELAADERPHAEPSERPRKARAKSRAM